MAKYGVSLLADVRSFLRSFKNPQFNSELIEKELPACQIQYVWLQRLGGRRKGFGRESKNTCWKNKSFRNYADCMETSAFSKGIDELTQMMSRATVAIMCAEAVYWRCHRSMIAEFLKSKGIQVTHILDGSHTKDHEYTKCAKVRNGQLTYHDQSPVTLCSRRTIEVFLESL